MIGCSCISFPDEIDCPKCGRSYKRRESMNRHRKFECGVDPKFKCQICQMRFKRKDKLKAHERRHPKDPLLVSSSDSTRTSRLLAAELASRRDTKR